LRSPTGVTSIQIYLKQSYGIRVFDALAGPLGSPTRLRHQETKVCCGQATPRYDCTLG
jgi:hypothetical protein